MPFSYTIATGEAIAAGAMDRTNDVKGLDVYRKLTKFGENAWLLPLTSFQYAEELLSAVQELLRDNYQPSDDFVGSIVSTIDNTLFHHYHNSRSFQRRSRIARVWRNLSHFDRSLNVLYLILRELDFERIHKQIDGSLFSRHRDRIFIFPGYPSASESAKGWHYSHGRFLLPPQNNASAKWIPFNKVQHVVHNVKDLLNILHLTDSKRQIDVGSQISLKGRTHFVYNGPNLIWFSPQPPSTLFNNHLCPSLDPDHSRYGCFRLSLSFRVIANKYRKVYHLGTRKFNQEHCHSFLLTPPEKKVMFIEELPPMQLTSSELIREEHPDLYHWLCYRDDAYKAWDLVDFAVSASELNLAIKADKVHLDSIDHSSPCVPSITTRTTCNSPKTKIDAMQCFLKELSNINMTVSKLRNIFEDQVYSDLNQLTV